MRRLAVPSDLEAVYRLYMHPDVVPFLGFDPMAKSAFSEVFDALLACQSFFVIERDNQVQAFYRISRHQGRARHVACLGTFAVAPEARGGGFAGEILQDAIQRLRSEGVTRVELLVEADNPRAIAFYRKLGFEQEGTMRSAYKRASDPGCVDELMFALLLPRA